MENRLRNKLQQIPSSEARVECSVDLADNSLSRSDTLAQMLQNLRETSLHVTTLRLYKNRYDDSAATALADHICEAAAQHRPLMQLHVSNNCLTEAGVRLLIEAAHRSQGYPRSTNSPELKSLGQDSGRRALWLRVENQDPPIARPQDLLDECNSAGIPVCVLAEGSGQRLPAGAVVQMHEYFLSGPSARSFGKGRGKGGGQQANTNASGLQVKPDKGKGKSEISCVTPSGTCYRLLQRGAGVICIQCSGVGMVDNDLDDLAKRGLLRLKEQIPSSEARVECSVDLADNSLSRSDTLAQMLQNLRETSLHVTTLRLYKNRYDDSAATALADHICEAAAQHRPLMQLHVSNNCLTEAGVRLLIEAAHRSQGYPRSTNSPELKSLGQDSGRRALWLRVENQDPPIARPQDLLDECNSAGIPVCLLAEGSGQRLPAGAVVQMHEYFLSGPSAQSFGKGRGKGGGQQANTNASGLQVKPGKGKGKSEISCVTPSGTCYRLLQRGAGVICIQCSGVGMVDNDLDDLAKRGLLRLKEQIPSSEARVECSVDLADNSLSRSDTLAQMLQNLRETSLHVTTLRLYKNRYDDSAATALADHICEAAAQHRPLMQLHVSNNCLTEAGVRLLIEAAHRSQGYPRSTNSPELKSLGQDSGRRALWLRVENQDPPIARPQDLLDECNSAGIPVCVLAEGSGHRLPAGAVVQIHPCFSKRLATGLTGWRVSCIPQLVLVPFICVHLRRLLQKLGCQIT